jgi:hypothetical protein
LAQCPKLVDSTPYGSSEKLQKTSSAPRRTLLRCIHPHFGAYTVKTILGIILICGLIGCGGSSNNSSTAVINLSGDWQITGHSTLFDFTDTGSATLQQSGSSVAGTVTLSGTPCATSGTVSGSISGTTLTFQIEEGTQPVNFTGTVNSAGTSASGSYTAPSGGCTNGDYGTWSATKTS